MRDLFAPIAPIAAVAGALGLCCGLPILLTLGVVGTIAGWSLESWALIGLGLVLGALGWVRIRRARRQHRSCQPSGAAQPVDAGTAQTPDPSTVIGTVDIKRENHL